MHFVPCEPGGRVTRLQVSLPAPGPPQSHSIPTDRPFKARTLQESLTEILFMTSEAYAKRGTICL